ncbi:VOC family protein [Nitrosomonas sp.]|uniref:VOC family protein n=1 Tax=Nitrosomonas sp. TaxID=42353 RepID=UPI001DC1BAA1|nr:VOC family protein [Nitrosomonas sp.]MBX9635974.1 VOC family protein [Nitrosomonas sp.]MBY0483542.1 VOC family protein [Nitrosomonas sp.]
MTIEGMNHFTVLSSNLERSKAFYVNILGLTEGYRPPFDFPGAWLYAENQAILHIMTGKQLPANAAGVIDHMAFTASNLHAVVNTLKQNGVHYELRRLKGLESWQLFFHDPDGAKVELDFPASEPEPKE